MSKVSYKIFLILKTDGTPDHKSSHENITILISTSLNGTQLWILPHGLTVHESYHVSWYLIFLVDPAFYPQCQKKQVSHALTVINCNPQFESISQWLPQISLYKPLCGSNKE